jgi:outer membrane protein assembly factor BamB
VSNGVVYIGSVNNTFYTYNAATGVPGWSLALNGSILATPAVANRNVYFTTNDGFLRGLDAATGSELEVLVSIGPTGYSSPAVVGGVAYIGTSDGKLYAAPNRFGGSPLWVATTGGFSINTAPVVYNNMVYVGSSDSKIDAFDALTGSLIWSTHIPDVATASPAIANGILYGITYNSGQLFALDAYSGKVLWSGAATTAANQSSPAISNGMVFVGSNGDLYAFALNGGNSAQYAHHRRPPSYALLRPDRHLTLSR